MLELLNPFGVTEEDFDLKNAYKLHVRFTVFFCGSLIAIVYFNIRNNTTINDFLKRPLMQKIVDNGILVLFLLQFQFFSLALNSNLGVNGTNACLYKYTFLAGLYQSVSLIVLLFVSSTSPIAKLYNWSYFKECGKYSFGLYLFHPMIIEIFKEINERFPVNFRLASEPIFIIHALTYMVAAIWFQALEDNLMKLANMLCRKLDAMSYFANRTIQT